MSEDILPEAVLYLSSPTQQQVADWGGPVPVLLIAPSLRSPWCLHCHIHYVFKPNVLLARCLAHFGHRTASRYVSFLPKAWDAGVCILATEDTCLVVWWGGIVTHETSTGTWEHVQKYTLQNLAQKRQGPAGKSPAEDHKDDTGPGASPVWGTAERPASVQPWGKKTKGRSYQCL